MKRVDFTRPGGFPLEQETLALLQDAYRIDFFSAFKDHLGVETGENYIISDPTEDINGWAIITGLLVPIEKTTTITPVLRMTRTSTGLVFGTNKKEKVYITYIAQYVTGSIPDPVINPLGTEDKEEVFSYFKSVDLKRITNLPDLAVKFLRLDGSTPMQGDLNLGDYQLSKLETKETLSATVRSADFNLGHSERRGEPGRALVDNANTLGVNFAQDWDITQIYGQINLPNLVANPGQGGTPVLIDANGNVSKGDLTFRGSVPLGLIALWNLGNVPDGWIVCDGTQTNVNGIEVPDLTAQSVATTKYIMYVGNFNKLPVVNAGQDITLQLSSNGANNKVTLEGSATDDDGTIASYTWTKKSGGAATIASPLVAQTEVTGLVAGTYVFRLTVTDKGGATTYDDVRVTVQPANSNPVISSVSGNTNVSYSIGGGNTVLTAVASDPDNDAISYTWTKKSGPSGLETLSGTNTSALTVSGMTSGIYKFLLVVKDTSGAKTERTTAVTVVQRPTIRIIQPTVIGPTSFYTLRVSGTPNTDVTIIGKLTRKDSGGTMAINQNTLFNVGNTETFTVRLDSTGNSQFNTSINATTSTTNVTVTTLGSVSISGESLIGSSVLIKATYRRSSGGGSGPDVILDTTCFSLDSKVLLANGAHKLLKNVRKGDKLLGFDFVNRIDASAGDYFNWEGNLKEAAPVEVTVKDMATFTATNYFEITLSDQSILKVTPSHPLLAADAVTENNVAWIKPTALLKGMCLVDKTGALKEIDTIILIDQKLEVGILDVEEIDNYIIGDVVVHNAELQSTLDGQVIINQK